MTPMTPFIILAASMTSQIVTPVIILGAMGLIFGLVLAFAAKVFTVTVDPGWSKSFPCFLAPIAVPVDPQVALAMPIPWSTEERPATFAPLEAPLSPRP